MRAYELFETLNWAYGKNADKASGSSRNDLKSSDYEIVWVDIKDLFNKTGSQQKLDVDDPRGGENSIGNRVATAKEHWANGGFMNLSIVGWNDYFNSFDFTDGRHRLVAAYQLGERWAPILVDYMSIDKLKELVRTK